MFTKNLSIKEQKLLYHLTSLNNLESILINGLVARKYIHSFDDIADPEIIDFREKNGLNDYVPFHFFAGNPFDGKVQKASPDKEFIYICVHRKLAKLNNFKIIPRHPASMGLLTLYDYLNGIEVIDWDTMDNRNYSNQDCKHICMAECLSPIKVTSDSFNSIYVKNEEIKDYILNKYVQILKQISPFHINVNKNMFVS